MVKSGIFYLVPLKDRLTADDLLALCELLVLHDHHEHGSFHVHDGGGDDVHLHFRSLPLSVNTDQIVSTIFHIPETGALPDETPASFSNFFTPPA